MSRKTLLAAVTAVIGLSAAQAPAAVIAYYDFQDPGPNANDPSVPEYGPEITAASVSGGDFTGNGTFSARAYEFVNGIAVNRRLDINNADPAVFTSSLTIEPGFQLNLTGLSFTAFSNRNSSVTVTINGTQVYSSPVTGDSSNPPNAEAGTFSLLGLTGTIPVVVSFDLVGATANRDGGFDDFQLTGTVVPEPASLSLLALGGLGLLRRRRGA
jgi:hypothetical protein